MRACERVGEPGDFNYQSGVISEQSTAVIVHNQQESRQVVFVVVDRYNTACNRTLLSSISQRIRAQQRDNQPRCLAQAWPFYPHPPHQLRSPERPLSLNQSANTSVSFAQGLSAEVNTAADMSGRVSGTNSFFLHRVTQSILPPPPLLAPLLASHLIVADGATRIPLYSMIHVHVLSCN